MRQINQKSTFSLRAALLAFMALAVLLPSVAARAADDDDKDEAIDNKIFRNVIEGLGLRERDREIDYRERSPLVVPPNVSALPPPDVAGAQASVPANWPTDQDVKRAKAAKAAERKLNYRRSDSAMGEEDRPLSPDKLSPGGSGRGVSSSEDPRNSDPYNRESAEESSRPSKPSLLGSIGNLFSNKTEKDVAVFRGEPARDSLTEPPVGYQTPSPSQPYGLTGAAPLPQAQTKSMDAPR
jgi:hypothetical protein